MITLCPAGAAHTNSLDRKTYSNRHSNRDLKKEENMDYNTLDMKQFYY